MPGFAISGGSGPEHTTETARKNRFLFAVLRPLSDILIYAHKAQRPIPEIDRIIIHHGQDEIYWPGKNRWQPIDISFYEKANQFDTTAMKIYEWWSQSVIDIASSKIASFGNNASIEMLSGDGTPIWAYILNNCWPLLVTPDQLDYSNSEIAEITVKLSYDKAKEG